MSIPSYLLIILFTAHFAYGYTVVLTSGKRIEGSLINDQQDTIVIKDSHGVLISFKKSMLDLDAMSVANAKMPANVVTEAPLKRQTRSLVEIAAETRKRRTGKAKTLSMDDMDETTTVSTLGSDHEEPQRSTGTDAGTSEREWQSRLWSLKKEVNRLREKSITAQSSCETTKEKQYDARTTPGKKPIDLLSTYKESAQCRKMAELESQLQEAERRLDNAREEARRQGVSWQSLE